MATTTTKTKTIPTEVLDYLGLHHVITVSTPSFTGIPHADTVVYVNDETQLYFHVVDGSTLARNIHDSKYVSFTIDDYLPDWRKLRELQGVGRGRVSGDVDVRNATSMFAAKFGPAFAPPGRLHSLSPIEMHFVDYDYALTVHPGREVLSRVFRLNGNSSSKPAPVATRLDRLVVEAGQLIFRPGERTEQYFVVLDGMVEVRTEGIGADQTVTRVGPGQMFGDRAAFGQPGALTAHAIERTELLAVARDAIRDLVMPRDG